MTNIPKRRRGFPSLPVISAVAVRRTYRPEAEHSDIDAGPWCRCLYAAMQLRMSAWVLFKIKGGNKVDLVDEICESFMQ